MPATCESAFATALKCECDALEVRLVSVLEEFWVYLVVKIVNLCIGGKRFANLLTFT